MKRVGFTWKKIYIYKKLANLNIPSSVLILFPPKVMHKLNLSLSTLF